MTRYKIIIRFITNCREMAVFLKALSSISAENTGKSLFLGNHLIMFVCSLYKAAKYRCTRPQKLVSHKKHWSTLILLCIKSSLTATLSFSLNFRRPGRRSSRIDGLNLKRPTAVWPRVKYCRIIVACKIFKPLRLSPIGWIFNNIPHTVTVPLIAR